MKKFNLFFLMSFVAMFAWSYGFAENGFSDGSLPNETTNHAISDNDNYTGNHSGIALRESSVFTGAAEPCDPVDDLDENFDDSASIPACWSSIINSANNALLGVMPVNAHSAPNCVQLSNGSDADGELYLITPELNTLSDGDHRLRFFAKALVGNPSVEIGTMSDPDDATTFSLVESFDGFGMNYQESTSVFDQSYSDSYIAIKVVYSSANELLYLDDVVWESTPNCPEPTELMAENISQNSADLSWTAGGSETEWEVIYGEEGFSPESEGTTVSDDDGNLGVTLDNLTSNTAYDFYVKAICSDTVESNWSVIGQFTTTCDIYPLDYSEDFSEFTPTCWKQYGEGSLEDGPSNEGLSTWFGTDWLNDDDSGGGFSNQAAYINLFSDTREDWLVSPEIDLSAPAELTYMAAVTDHGSTDAPTGNGMGSDDEVQVLITTDGGTTWENLKTYNQSDYPSETGDLESISLFGYSGTVQIAFWGHDGPINDDEDYDFFIDDFTISEITDSCPAPANIAFENINTTTVDISWSAADGQDEWEVLYGEEGFDPDNDEGTSETVMNNTETTLTGLVPNTDYEVYVRAVCASNDLSDWTGPEDFTTTTDEEQGCEWTVEIDGSGSFGDEVTWELRENGNVILSGGPYEDLSFQDEQSVTAEGPVEFYVNTMGDIGDNELDYTVSNENGVLISEHIDGDQEATHSGLNCEDEGEDDGGDDYCEPLLDCSGDDLISNVSFVEIDNDTDCSEDGYGDYTDQEANVSAGETYTINVTVSDGWDPESVSVWIDYDESGTFDEEEFTYVGSGTDETLSQDISIPEDVADGSYRMRVRVAAVGEDDATWDMACDGTQGFGETEDYTINVGPLSVDQYQFDNFTYYPNPVKDQMTLKAGTQIETVTVYNLLGQKVISSTPSTLQTQLQTGGLQSGVYLMKVSLNGQQKTFRIIKN